MRHTETWDGVEDHQIFERDNWECLVPGCTLGPIRFDLAWPAPLSPSIDHIVPCSLGGADTAPNKRAAHLRCNISRGNRMHPDDVQIITPQLAPLGIFPPLKPAKQKQLVYCQTCENEVKTAGATCRECKQEERAERRKLILECREQGMRWVDIAAKFGLSGPGAAHNIAHGYGHLESAS